MPKVKIENLRHLKRYIDFINSRPTRKLRQKGFSTHHIYPTSIAIKNNKLNYKENSNLIELTHREHFIAHLILYYCGYEEMTYAFRRMNNYKGNTISGAIYQKLQEDWSRLASKRMKNYHKTHDLTGENATNYGKKASEESKKKMSESHLGKKLKQSSIDKRTLKQKGMKRSQAFCEFLSKREISKSTREQISKTNLGRRQVTNGIITYYIKKDKPVPEGFFFVRHKKFRSSEAYQYVFNLCSISIEKLQKAKFTKPTIFIITNDIENKAISSFNKIPFGWKKGTKVKERGKSIWINNGIKTIKYLKNKELPEGFVIGSLVHSNKIWITNGINNKHINEDEIIPENWVIGMTKNFSEKGRLSLRNSNKNKTYITNGIITKQHNNLDKIPDGWFIGRSLGNKGKIYITNEIENKLIYMYESIPEGWKRGLTKKTRNQYSK